MGLKGKISGSYYLGVQYVIVLFSSFVVWKSSSAQLLDQRKVFTRQDTLRGMITPERAWWDVMRYTLNVEPDYKEKSIRGSNTISFKTVSTGKLMQVDLQQPLIVDSILDIAESRLLFTSKKSKKLSYRREGNVIWVDFVNNIASGLNKSITIYYHGKPIVGARPPWDGGWIWNKDKNGNPWMSVACQGLGASVWYPCKDHQSDEPDRGASLTITAPDSLVAIGNGRLKEKKQNNNHTTSWTWEVLNPINNYDIVPYIGKYVHWSENYNGEKGILSCDYWVLDYNLEKAMVQFKQVPLMLACFEDWFGPYPFYEDGYKMVEAPHLGMEHQSAVAYGNKFQNGYLGRDLSGSGWGTKWDFIIVHESGHEWFGNNITTNDLADMWVHEGFTNYSETIFTGCEYGKEAGNEYCRGTRRLIRNDTPIIGRYGVNEEGSGDMYYKGGNLIHMIRQIINDDESFRQILRGLNKEFYHKTVDSRQVEDFISHQSGIDFSKTFDQYLRTTQIPVLEYKTEGNKIIFRWTNCIKGFNMPVKLTGKNNTLFLYPVEEWRTLVPAIIGKGNVSDWTKNAFDPNFYITVKKVD